MLEEELQYTVLVTPSGRSPRSSKLGQFSIFNKKARFWQKWPFCDIDVSTYTALNKKRAYQPKNIASFWKKSNFLVRTSRVVAIFPRFESRKNRNHSTGPDQEIALFSKRSNIFWLVCSFFVESSISGDIDVAKWSFLPKSSLFIENRKLAELWGSGGPSRWCYQYSVLQFLLQH